MTDQFQHHQTPMSSKLTSMLILLRDDCLPQDRSTDSDERASKVSESSQNEGDSEDIILGGDVCNCRKSKCLKLYCQCFNAARVCNPLCRCTDCFNTDSNEAGRSEAVKIILDRNPSAFDSKFLSRALQAQQPAHKSGCKCRKSMCLKKYCECFEASLPCSNTCVCVDCHNTPSHAAHFVRRQDKGVEVAGMCAAPLKSNRYNKTAGKAKIKPNSVQNAHKNNSSIIEASSQSSARSSTDIADETSKQSREVAVIDQGEKIEGEDVRGSVKDDALSDSSIEGALTNESEEQPRHLSHPTKRSPDSVVIGTLGKEGAVSFASVRPTMLSRVVTVRKRSRDSLGSLLSEDDRHLSQSSSSMSGDKRLHVEDLTDRHHLREISPSEGGVIPLHFLSPISSSMPIISQLGKLGATAAGLKRFVSPNTASVASALSLLSRLPYCQLNS